MTRPVGLRGRLPARQGTAKFALRWLHDYVTDHPLPAIVYPVALAPEVTDLGMDGNGPDPTLTVNGGTPVGDCVVAAAAHNVLFKIIAGRLNETAPTADEVVSRYLAYTGGQDVGCVVADFLLWCYQQGFIDAFAPVDHTDRQAVDSAIVPFNGVIVAGPLFPNSEDQFANGQVWDPQGTQPDPDMGHAILKIGSDGTALDEYATWGTRQKATLEWSHRFVGDDGEAWVVVSAEDAAAANLDFAALLADINALGGTGGDTPIPPVPEPVPVPDPPAPVPPAPTPEPPMPPTDFPTNDPVADQATADHDLAVATDEETIAAAEAQAATDAAAGASADAAAAQADADATAAAQAQADADAADAASKAAEQADADALAADEAKLAADRGTSSNAEGAAGDLEEVSDPPHVIAENPGVPGDTETVQVANPVDAITEDDVASVADPSGEFRSPPAPGVAESLGLPEDSAVLGSGAKVATDGTGAELAADGTGAEVDPNPPHRSPPAPGVAS